MKKIRFAGLMLIAPLTLLCACGGGSTALTLDANWYKKTDTTTSITGTKEELEYAVTFKKSDLVTSTDYSLTYNEGTYKTLLQDEQYRFDDGTTTTLYHYSTRLDITGVYTLRDQTYSFVDFVVSDVYFLNIAEGLRPIKSVKTVHSTSPFISALSVPEKLEDAYRTYYFTATTQYDTDLTEATITTTDLSLDENDESRTTEVTSDIKGSGSFFDNEQILFALRGLDMTSAVSFRTINPLNNRTDMTVKIVQTPSAVSEARKVVVDGTEVDQVFDAYSFDIMYSVKNSGYPQTIVCAKKTSSTENAYRNVLLRYEAPVIYQYGTLTYVLTKADFTSI